MPPACALDELMLIHTEEVVQHATLERGESGRGTTQLVFRRSGLAGARKWRVFCGAGLTLTARSRNQFVLDRQHGRAYAAATAGRSASIRM